MRISTSPLATSLLTKLMPPIARTGPVVRAMSDHQPRSGRAARRADTLHAPDGVARGVRRHLHRPASGARGVPHAVAVDGDAHVPGVHQDVTGLPLVPR